MVLSLVLTITSRPALTAEGFGRNFLEEPSIVAVGNESEIHINFSTAVRYVRHFPERKGNLLRVSLEVVDPCAAEDILMQESRWLPPADWHEPFTVTFPDTVKRPSNGPAICPATHNHVYVAQTVSIKFGKEVAYKVRPGDDGHSIVVIVPVLKQPESAKAADKTKPPVSVSQKKTAETPAAPVPVAPEKQQDVVSIQTTEPRKPEELPPADLLVAGRTALTAGDPIKAIQMFNRLLNLPPNDYSQEAQELVGVARENANEIEKAKVEYQLYLKLYPAGEGAERVKQRLAALEAQKNVPKQAMKQAKPKKQVREIHQNTFTGGISQYYYAGKTQSRFEDGTGATAKIRSTDQSMLITNVDATGRFRHNQYDTKIVYRDTQLHNFLPGTADKNTVSSAYLEHQNKVGDYMFRVGRQSGTSQGVLGRFDGIFARYGLNPQWRITAVAGQPDKGSHSHIQTDRHFYGAGVEFGPLAEKWSGSVYAIQQIADGLVERRAVGSEVRYFSGTTSWFGMLDYDTVYNAVNIAMLQGNWTTEGGYNFNVLLDHRKSPILYGETATQVVPGISVGDLHQVLSSSDITSTVKALVPNSDMAMVGVTKQVTDRWQVGGDVRVSRVGATDGTTCPETTVFTCFPAQPQPGISNNFTYTVQAIGNNTLFKDDTSVIMASYVDDPQYSANNFSLANSLMLGEKWRIDSALRYYREERDAGQKTWQIAPSVRMSYRWNDTMSFEAQLNIDRTHLDDPNPSSPFKNTTWRESIFAGYRWDFR